MVRRLRLHNKNKRVDISTRLPEKPAVTGDSFGFSLKFVGGKGVLVLGEQRLLPLATVSMLEMEIPRLIFPFDVSHGVAGLATRRLTLGALRLVIRLSGLEERLEASVASDSWVSSPRVSLETDCVSVSLLYGPDGDRVPVTLRLLPRVIGRELVLLMDDVRAYGAVPAPLLNVGAAICAELMPALRKGATICPTDPVREVLLHVLGSRGWRLPDYTDVVMETVAFHSDKICIDYVAKTRQPAAMTPVRLTMDTLKRLEELRTLRDADDLLANGEVDAARTAYAALLDSAPEKAVPASRMAMIDLLDSRRQLSVVSRLKEMVADGGGRLDVLTVAAQAGAVIGDEALEAQAHKAMFSSGYPLEKAAAALRLADLLEGDLKQAADYLEKALSVNRTHKTLLGRLLEMAAQLKDTEQVERLLDRWLSAQESDTARVEALCRLGEIFGDDLENYPRALSFLEQAEILAPDDAEVIFRLSRTLAETGDPNRAIAGFEKLLRRFSTAKATSQIARCHRAIGQVWIRQGKPELAIPRLRESLQLGGNWDTQVLLATALVSVGQIEEAVGHYESVLGRQRSYDATYAQVALTLARLYVFHLADYDAALRWIGEARLCNCMMADIFDLERQVLEKQEDWERLSTLLERNLVAHRLEESTDDTTVVETVIGLSRARLGSGNVARAFSILSNAVTRYPDHRELLEMYVDSARQLGEHATLYESLRRLLTVTLDADRRMDILKELGQLALANDDTAAAGDWFEKALALGEDAVAREGMVAVLSIQGDNRALVAALEHLVTGYRSAGQQKRASDSMCRLARLQHGQGDLDGAIDWWRRALPDVPSERRQEVLIELAGALYERGDYAGARETYGDARTGSDMQDNALAALGEAESALRLKRFQEAYSAAVAAGSGPRNLRVRATRTLAAAAPHIGRADEAVGIITRVAQNVSETERVELYMLAGELARQSIEDWEVARNAYESALEIDEENERARNRLLSLLEEKGDRRLLAEGLVRFSRFSGDRVKDLQRAADFLMAEGRSEKAVEILQDAISQSADVETVRMLKAAMKAAGRVDDMIEMLKTYARQDVEVRDMLVDALEEQGRLSDAGALLERFPETDTSRELVRLRRLAALGIKEGDRLKSARFLIEASQKSEPGDTKKLLEQAMGIAREENHPQLFARCIDGMREWLSPQAEGELLLELCLMYNGQGRAEDALLVVERLPMERLSTDRLLAAAKEAPAFNSLLNAIWEHVERREEWEVAEALFEIWGVGCTEEAKETMLRRRAKMRETQTHDLSGAVDDWLALFERGILNEEESASLEALLVRAGRADDHLRVLRQSMSRESKVERIERLVEGGQLHMDQLTDYSGALALFQQAADISPDEPDVLLGLADCGWHTDRYELITSSIERLGIVAPHLNLDAVRQFRFAYALAMTGAWPRRDVLDLLERIIPDLPEAESARGMKLKNELEKKD